MKWTLENDPDESKKIKKNLNRIKHLLQWINVV
jgi:hypothetical protein